MYFCSENLACDFSMLQNKSMYRTQEDLTFDKHWFYERFARENNVDYVQLLVLDILDEYGGKASWNVLYQSVNRSIDEIQDTVYDLEDQKMLVVEGDLVKMLDYTHFLADDLIQQCRSEYCRFLDSTSRKERECQV